MRKHLFGLTAFILLLVTLPFSPTAFAREPVVPEAHTFRHITVVSYNIHWGIGMDQVYDLDRIAAVLAKTRADVIGLQEVDEHWAPRHGSDDQLRYLATKLGMYTFYAPMYTMVPVQPGEPIQKTGVAVLSRFPIVSAENLSLIRMSTEDLHKVPVHKPGFAAVRIDIAGTPIRVYVTHLDYRADSRMRTAQVKQMLEVLTRDTLPQIVLGDFNAEPNANELRPLLRRYHSAHTYCTGICQTYPADQPKRLLDYVLVSRDLGIGSAKVIESETSDHRPVVASVRIPMNPASP